MVSVAFLPRPNGGMNAIRWPHICPSMDTSAQTESMPNGDKMNAPSHTSVWQTSVFSLLKSAAWFGIARPLT